MSETNFDTEGYDPIGNRLLVEISKATERTSGGIIKPPSAQKRDARDVWIVIAVGEGRTLDDGRVVPIPLVPGDRVLFVDGLPLPVNVPRATGLPDRYIVTFDLIVCRVKTKPEQLQ